MDFDLSNVTINVVTPHSVFPAMIALSAVQSFVRIPNHNVILFINSSTILGTTKAIG